MKTLAFLILGAAALVAGMLVVTLGGSATLAAYLCSIIFVLGISLGSMAWMSMHRLTGGRWGEAAAPVWRAAAAALPVAVLLLIPLVIRPGSLYHWMGAPESLPPALQGKTAYLNWPFFMWRAIGYWVLWCLWIWALLSDRWRTAQSVGALGLAGFFITVTFSAIDWVMSLEPEWYSTIYGLYFIVDYALTAILFGVAVMSWRALLAKEPRVLGERQLRWDFANLMLAFILFWGYTVVSQLIIIWSENLPEEVKWYMRRAGGGWLELYLFVVFVHALSFLILLHRGLKQNIWVMALMSSTLLLARLAETYWLVLPGSGRTAALPRAVDVLIFIVVAGLWAAAVWVLLRRPAWRSLRPAAAACALLLCLPAAAHATRDPKAVAEQVGVEEHLGANIDMGWKFTTQSGEQKTVRELVPPGRPFLIVPVYFQCPMLCPMTLRGLTNMLNGIPLKLGEDFSLLTVSMSTREGVNDSRPAAEKYQELVKVKPVTGWHFLTGAEDQVHGLLHQVGFRYLPDSNDFMHTAVMIVLGPDGKISRYQSGVTFDPGTTRLSLIEASQGKIGSTVDQVFLYCFHYDASTGRYTPAIMNIVRMFSAAIVLALIAGVVVTYRARQVRER